MSDETIDSSNNETLYGVARDIEACSKDDVDHYWLKVKETLRRVFHQSDPDRMADDLRQRVTTAGPDTELHFYHSDPLQVAADLSGHRSRPLSAEEKSGYWEVLRDLDGLGPDQRPTTADFDWAPPENPAGAGRSASALRRSQRLG